MLTTTTFYVTPINTSGYNVVKLMTCNTDDAE